MKSRKIIVFGSNGFIGSNVLTVLKDSEGVEVFSVDQSGDNLDFEVDLTNKQEVFHVLDEVKPQVAINCAGIVSRDHCMLNPLFSMNILTSLAELKSDFICKMIVMGSASEYGPVDTLPVSEEQSLTPDSDYGMSKLIETMSALHYGKMNKIDVVVTRLFNPIGLGMHKRNLLPSLIKQMKDLKEGKIDSIEVNRLNSKRDFLDVVDVANAVCILALAPNTKHSVYNIGSGEGVSVRDIVTILARKFDLEGIETVDLMNSPESQYACRANSDRLSSEFGWKATKDVESILNELAL